MVISKDPDASKDDLGLRKKMSSTTSNVHKRAATSYQTNINIRQSRTPDLQTNENYGNKMMNAMVEGQTRLFEQNAARRSSRSFSANAQRNQPRARPTDPAVLKSGMSANEVAERLHRHKTKTEARLEKERQTKI